MFNPQVYTAPDGSKSNTNRMLRKGKKSVIQNMCKKDKNASSISCFATMKGMCGRESPGKMRCRQSVIKSWILKSDVIQRKQPYLSPTYLKKEEQSK